MSGKMMSERREIPMVLDESNDAVIIVDSGKTIKGFNRAAEDLWNVTRNNILGCSFKDFIQDRVTKLNLEKLLEGLSDKTLLSQAVDMELTNAITDAERYRFYTTACGDEIMITIKKIEKIRLSDPDVIADDLMFFTNISSTLSEMVSEDEVFTFLGTKLNELLPKTIILINKSDVEGNYLRLEKVYGLQQFNLGKLFSILGFNPVGRSYKLIEEFKNKYSKPVLYHCSGGLYEFCNNEITRTAAELIEKSLKISSIHTIGIANQGQYFGFIHFLSNKSEIIKKPLIESLIFLCYLTISRIKSMQVLELREKQYKLLAENVKDVIFTLDLDLKYTYISPSIKNLRDYDPLELIGESVSQSLSPESYNEVSKIFNEEIEKIKKGKDIASAEKLFEIELLQRDGTIFWSEVKASFIYDNHQNIIGILGVSRDINERKLAEIALRQKNLELKEANAQKDRFFSILAHDLKSPFGHILNFSSLLNEHYFQYPEEKRKQFISLINSSSQKIYLLLENLLDWARSQGGKMDFFPQKVKLDKLITEILDLFHSSADAKSITLLKEINLKLPLHADEYMLKTIIRNLIGNAIKFTSEGGKVLVEAWSENNEILISVTDTGVGMDPEMSSMLFSLDFNESKNGTNGEKGTGLGLLLCKDFVEMHGGRIWVKSKAGEGSIFTFSIPVNLPKRNSVRA